MVAPREKALSKAVIPAASCPSETFGTARSGDTG
jgi:hypothetical protein